MSLTKTICRYLVRICVFQLGEYKRGFFARFLIRFLKKTFHLSDKKVALGIKAFDQAIILMEDLGGVRYSKTTADELSNIDYMLLTFNNIKKRIEEKGGKWLEVPIDCQINSFYYKTGKTNDEPAQYLNVIYAEYETHTWNEFAKNVLSQMGWKKAIIEFDEKKVTGFIVHELSKKIKDRDEICFLRCHSPGRSYAMDRKYIGRHLSLKKDICLFNYRGTHRSTGDASEGGYYLDADAIFQELITTFGYKPEQIWVTGFCLGGAVAAFVKAKYHSLGVNYAGENTFASLISVIEHQLWPANILGKLAVDAVQSSNPLITNKVKQDLFNTLEKFNGLQPQDKKSTSIIISTDADKILPKDSGLKLYLSAKQSGNAHFIEHKSKRLKDQNPHADDVFDEPRVWEEYSTIINAATSRY